MGGEIIYREIKEKGMAEYMLSNKEAFIEFLWGQEPFTSNHFYFERSQYEWQLDKLNKELIEVKNTTIQEFYERGENSRQKYIEQFERDASEKEKHQIEFLMDSLKRLCLWNPPHRESQLFKKFIRIKIAESIDDTDINLNGLYPTHYTYEKSYTLESAAKEKESVLNDIQNQILRFESKIKIRDDFTKRVEEYFQTLNKSLENL